MATWSFGKIATETPKSSAGKTGFKCVSLKKYDGMENLLAQHGPSELATPGITFIILSWNVVFVLFKPLDDLLTIILNAVVGLNIPWSKP